MLECAGDHANSSTIQHAFLWGPGVDQLLSATESSGSTAWAISDPHGTIDQWVDSSGNLLAGATLDSFGNPATHSATTPESLDLYFSYTGKYRDPLTGEQYNNARWYDPATGRFLSHDPIEADANSYRYAGNDPVNSSDPSGLKTGSARSAAEILAERDATNRQIGVVDQQIDSVQALAESLNRRIGDRNYGSLEECLGLKEERDKYLQHAEALQSQLSALSYKNLRLYLDNRDVLGIKSAKEGDADSAGSFASDYWYYLTHPDRMDSDLKTANKVAYGMIAVGGGGALAASAAAAGAGAALAGAVGGAAGGGIGSVGSQLTDTGRVDAGHRGVDVVAGAAGGALGGALLPAAGGSLARSIGAGAGGGGLGGGLAGGGHAALDGQPILPSAARGTLLGALVGGLFSAGFHGIDKALKSDVFRGGLFGKSCSAAGIGRYSELADSPSVGPGKNFTQSQKAKIYQQNMTQNGSVVRSDLNGEELVMPFKSARGVTPPANEAQIDHIIPRNPADPNIPPGTNSYSNAQVLSRQQNRLKSNK